MVDSLYIHIPFCLSKCKYCDFFSVEVSSCQRESTVINHSQLEQKSIVPDEYITALTNEISYRLKKYKITELCTIYIGGGTPSLLSEQQLYKILDCITANCKISPNAEVTIEVNPDDVSENLLKMYEKTYINRISCGIQTLNEQALSFCGRRAERKTNLNALEILKKWKGDLSLDLICGLPYEDQKSFLHNTLMSVINCQPSHISMYSLTIEEKTPLGELYNSGKIDYDFDFADDLWLKGYEILRNHGYNQYEISNFSLPQKQSKHNLKYWNHESYIGSGSGATGTVYNDDGTGERWTNKQNIKEYCDFWINIPSDKSQIQPSVIPNSIQNLNNKIPQTVEKITIENSKFEFFMMGLRKTQGINSFDYEKIFNEKIPQSVINLFEKWKNKNLADITNVTDGKNFRLNEKGILFLNSFLEQLEV